MIRHQLEPRPGWRETVESQGLTYAVSEDGHEYWNESAAYEFSETEIETLESVTQELHEMAMQATGEMVRDESLLYRLGLPTWSWEHFLRSWETEQDSALYGRFDLAYGGRSHLNGRPYLLEYNAETPAALVETVTQWYWLQDTRPHLDQWNMVHERLVAWWSRRAGQVVHFAVGQDEPTEDWATVAYLRDAAREAGVIDLGVPMEKLGYDSDHGGFVDIEDKSISTCFKMYPWDWMLEEDFGQLALTSDRRVQWIEPLWKTLTGSKALLVKLWEMEPGHPNLLPAYLGEPRELDAYAAKPVFGYEGAGVRLQSMNNPTADFTGIETLDLDARDASFTQGQVDVYQEFIRLPTFDGMHPVLGTWVVDGHAAGMGIRESSAWITDTDAHFVPHFINSPASTPEQIAEWMDS